MKQSTQAETQTDTKKGKRKEKEWAGVAQKGPHRNYYGFLAAGTKIDRGGEGYR
jgi:hypothetical protein